VPGANAFAQRTAAAPQKPDTSERRPFFSWKDVALLEAFAIATVAVAPLDKKYAERVQNPNVQTNDRLRKGAEFVRSVADPGSFLIGIGMYTYGRLRDNQRATDLGFHGVEALLIGAQTGNLLKGVIGRARPYVNIDRPHDYRLFRGFREGGDFRSFPSGHTIAAFAAASAVTAETHRWWPRSVWFIGPVMYTGAAAVGWSRMFNNKHWASDVITGAAIGTFAGQKVVQWHHSHPGNTIDRIFGVASIQTLPDGSTFVGLSLDGVGTR
jgi:hypothetical protein